MSYYYVLPDYIAQNDELPYNGIGAETVATAARGKSCL